MLIRIIDLTDVDGTEDVLRVEYQGHEWQKTFQTDLYDSPFSINFRKTLNWYFNQYWSQQTFSAEPDDKGVVQKVIRGGQGIGDELMGDDYELIKITEDIANNGFENLDVQLVSQRPEFFTELWETLILPDSKYMLSTVVKSFVRQVTTADTPSLPKIIKDLKATAPTDEHVAQLLQGTGEQPQQNTQADDKPLRVLLLTARPENVDLSYDDSNALALASQAQRRGRGVEYVVHSTDSADALAAVLSNKDEPIHVVQYDGPVFVTQDNVSFALGNDEQNLIDAKSLCRLMADNNIALLSVDARRFQRGTPKQVLAQLAKIALEQGLGNVLGLSQLTNPWIASNCFDGVYQQLVAGLELAQAVVEARKLQQKATSCELARAKPLNFHDWSLLVHYSVQPVQFFTQGLPIAQQDDPNYLTRVHEHLHGFNAQLMPPLLFQSNDGQSLSILRELATRGKASVVGTNGSGKSWLCHSVAAYLALGKQIARGFYFDFAQHQYSTDEMLEMIARLLQLPVDQPAELLKYLAQSRSLFVFDNLDNQAGENGLADLLGQLHKNGHLLIATGHDAEQVDILQAKCIATKPLPLSAQKVLCAHYLREAKLEDKSVNEDLGPLLEVSKGHPWLTQKQLSLLANQSVSDIVANSTAHLDFDGDLVEQYYQWQFASLSDGAKSLLCLGAKVPGLLFEMVATAADKKEPIDAANQLFAELDLADTRFGTLLNQWTEAGFLFAYPHGRVLDSRFATFLTAKLDEIVVSDTAQLNFSRLICDGVSVLSQSILSQPNQNITNNLLFNRRSWVEHFERLWQGKDYKGFFAVKNAFDQLLMQAKLLNDSELWTLDLLNRWSLSADAQVNDKVAWLSLATTVSSHEKAPEFEHIKLAQQQWQSWFDDIDVDMSDDDRPLFQQASSFLQGCYQREQAWQQAIDVTAKALKVYEQSQAWQRMIQAFKMLADYHSKLEDEPSALEYEFRILDDIPYEQAPPSFKAQQMVEIMMARLTRGNTLECQKMLDQIKDTTEEGQNLGPMLDNVQCEIDLRDERFEKAMPVLCRQWAGVLESQQSQQIEPFKERMKMIAQKMGPSLFDELFTANSPEGIDKPF